MLDTNSDTGFDTGRFRRAFPDDATVSDWRAADGWALRRIDWPAPRGASRGAILFQGGRGDVLEKYLETLAHWHLRGWSVTSFDWRGQGGSGRLSPDRHVGHADSFAPFVDDLAAVWRDWSARVAGPEIGGGPRILMGHSMGGHLALRAMLERRVDPDAAVLIAPMLGLKSPLGAWAGARVARFMRDRGDPARAAWKGHERPGPKRLDRQKMLTADRSRYEDEQWWYDRTPDIKLGPPSWAWLAEAFDSTLAQQDDERLETLDTPILMVVAERDRLVDPRAAQRVAARLRHAQMQLVGPDSAHEILREADGVRDQALARIDTFLDAQVSQGRTT